MIDYTRARIGRLTAYPADMLTELSNYYMGDGTVIRQVAAPYEMSRDKPEICGKIVNIEGTYYKVHSVERWLLGNTPIHEGEIIGLWVTEDT